MDFNSEFLANLLTVSKTNIYYSALGYIGSMLPVVYMFYWLYCVEKKAKNNAKRISALENPAGK